MSNKSIFTPINITGNILYECILKHRKCRRCVLLCRFFNYRELWPEHHPWIVFIQNHSTFSVIIGYHLTFLIIWSSWRFSGSKSNYWWPLPIPIDTISRAVTRVKRIFYNLRFILWYVISRMYFLWAVISKKYFSWTVMRPLSSTHLYVSVNVCKQTTPETCTRRI